MKSIFKYILGISFILMFYCCSKPKSTGKTVSLSDLPQINISAELNTVIEIKDWLAIGPFEFQPLFTDPAKTFFRTDLKQYGIKEGFIDEVAIENLQKQGINAFLIDVPSSQIKLFEYISKGIAKKSNFYLIARIHSEKTQDATLIADGSYSYAVWLNGEKQIEERIKYNVNKVGNRFVNVSLKKGENILFVKINRGTNKRSWDLICAIAPSQEAKRIFRVNYTGDFVVNPIINNFFEIYAGPYLNGKVEVVDSNNRIVANGVFNHQNTNEQAFVVSDLKKLEEGFYKTILTVGDEKLEEMIYKGDYHKFVKKANASVDEISDNSLYVKDLKIAMKRIDYLDDQPGDPNSPSEIRFLNRNRVFWGYSLYKMIQKNASTQFMTYETQENESGTFIFHIGNKQQQNIPLVIIVPSALQGNSMIEDWYTSNLDQIETDNTLADQYGFAVAWIYAGGRNYSANKTEKEIAAIIERLSLEYDIDAQRIYITGDCEGGRRALVQLATSPGRYAACVVSSPITLMGGADGKPIDLLSQIGKVPILIQHGVNDDVSPIENSRKFYEESQKLDMSVKYFETQGSHVSISKDAHRYIFEFFSQITSF